MQFRILGPIEAIPDSGGVAFSLGGRGPRAMLGALLIEQGGTLTRDALIDGLWLTPPATAAHAIEVYASRLRRALGQDRIICEGNAYRVRFEADELDLARFRSHAGAGRAAVGAGDLQRAADQFAAALATWRGAPLACLNGEPFAVVARAFLGEERLAVIEDDIDSRLALGRHRELVPELTRLVAEHPSWERLCERLMLTLYRCGRQVDALDAFAHLRTRLRNDLGIDPGAEVRELQRRILAHDPTLAAPIVVRA